MTVESIITTRLKHRDGGLAFPKLLVGVLNALAPYDRPHHYFRVPTESLRCDAHDGSLRFAGRRRLEVCQPAIDRACLSLVVPEVACPAFRDKKIVNTVKLAQLPFRR